MFTDKSNFITYYYIYNSKYNLVIFIYIYIYIYNLVQSVVLLFL